MEPTQTVDLLLIEVGRAISAKNADTVRGAITQLQSLLDTLKAAEDAEETAEGAPVAEAVDPNVGGGAERDKIPDSDFAGKTRSYPIVTPNDVADAAASIGRAGADNYSADELKSRIIAIAKRKGAAFVAQLPDAWKGNEAADPGEANLQEVELLEWAPVVGAKA